MLVSTDTWLKSLYFWFINIILTFCRLGRQPGWVQDPKVQPEQKWQWWAIEIVLKWIWLRAGKQKVKMVEIDTWCVLPSLSLSFMSHPAAKSRLTGGSHSRMHHYYQWHVYPAEKSMFNRQHHYCLLLSFGLLFRHYPYHTYPKVHILSINVLGK